MDSLDVVELGIRIEDEFGIEVADDEGAKLHSVGDVSEYIKAQVTAGTEGNEWLQQGSYK